MSQVQTSLPFVYVLTEGVLLIRPIQSSQRGVTLIMVAGVLAVLAALSAAFYTLTRSYTISAVRYSDSVRAQMLAHAGIDFAITR